MKNPPEYIYLIKLLIEKRGEENGYYSDIHININEIDTEQIKNKERLTEMLDDFKKDKVLIDYERETIIKDYEIDTDNNNITIYNSSIRKLELYAEMIMGNKIDLNNRHITPLLLPPGTTWESITIKFKDGHDVDIIIPEKSEVIQSSYIEMGFQNLKTRRPNHQWLLLITLSKNYRKISWDNYEANDKLKKQKQLLSEKLKKYFLMTEDPFRLYREEKSYEIKLNLISEDEQYRENIENDKLGIKEYFDENTPSV